MNLSLQNVPIEHIKVSAQVRTEFDSDSVHNLAISISSVGLQQPLLCRRIQGGGFELVDGERRLRACRDVLKWKDIAILLLADSDEATTPLARQLVANLQRADLNPIERAKGIEALIAQTSLTADAAAKVLGLSNAAITRSRSLLCLSEDLQHAVAVGELSADAAYMLSRLDNPEEQARTADQVRSGQLSRDALARKLKASRRSGERRAAGVTKSVATLGNGRSITLAGPGLTLETMMEWLENLLVRARKAKSQGITLETFVRALRDQSKGGKGVPS